MHTIERIGIAALVFLLLLRVGRAASFALKDDPAAQAPPPATLPAAPDGPRRLDDLLEPIRAKHKLPALAAAVVHGNGLKAIGAVGVREAGGTDRVTTDDLWHIGSDTKAMTATLCAILIEQGKLKWTTTLAEVFPDLASKMHEDFRTVTVEQLCTNRGGVPTDLNADGLWGNLWNHKGAPIEARHLLLESVTSGAPAYTPGAKFVYSNGGFAIAGHICETIARKPYEDLISELLFKPLGMTTVGFGAPGTPGKIDQPRGHAKGKPQEPTADGRGADNPPAITPAGRVHLSLADWGEFISLHIRGEKSPQHLGDVTLPVEVFKKMHTPPAGEYAMGWIRVERPWAGLPGDRWALTHAGSNTMWYAVVWIAPAKDFAVLVATNTTDQGDKGCDAACAAIIQQELAK